MKRWLTCMLLLFGLLSKPVSGATVDTTVIKRVADSLFLLDRYFEAGIYYQKLDFFLVGRTSKNEAKFSAANCYKYIGDYNAGIAHLNNIILEDVPDSIVYKAKYQCALMSYLDNDLARAESFLMQLHYLVADSNFALQTGLLHVLVLNEQYRWAEAKTMLIRYNNAQKINSSQCAYNRSMIDSLYNPNLMPKLKDREKAGRRSTFLPGLGQCYTKNYGEGITSFLAISATLGAMAVGIFYQYYFTSILTGNLLIGKFYQGGIKRSEFLADKYNYKKSKAYNESIRAVIKERFKR